MERSIKELLIIMLNNKKLFSDGLCRWIYCLQVNVIFTEKEVVIIKHYISINKPKKTLGIWGLVDKYYYKTNSFHYYWKATKIKPRIE